MANSQHSPGECSAGRDDAFMQAEFYHARRQVSKHMLCSRC